MSFRLKPSGGWKYRILTVFGRILPHQRVCRAGTSPWRKVLDPAGNPSSTSKVLQGSGQPNPFGQWPPNPRSSSDPSGFLRLPAIGWIRLHLLIRNIRLPPGSVVFWPSPRIPCRWTERRGGRSGSLWSAVAAYLASGIASPIGSPPDCDVSKVSITCVNKKMNKIPIN